MVRVYPAGARRNLCPGLFTAAHGGRHRIRARDGDGQLRGISGGVAYFYSSDRGTRQVRMDEVAVITFGGSTTGIDSGYADDTTGNDHLMVMRNGNRYAGTLQGTTTAGVRGGASPLLLFRIRSGSQLRVRP